MELILSCDPGESEFKQLGDVIHLTDGYPVPVDRLICAMQSPVMGRNIPHQQIHPTAQTRQTSPEPLPLGKTFPRASPSNRLPQQTQPNHPHLKRHCFRLGHVGHQANTYVDIPLKPFRIPQPNKTIIQVEYSQAPPHRMYQPIVDKLIVLHCHGQTMTYQYVHHHDKECWRCYPYLCGFMGRPGLGAMLSILLGDHLLPCQELRQNNPHFWSHPVPLQGLK